MPILDVRADAARAFEVIAGGGIALIPLDVAYAVLGNAGEAIRRIFEAKERGLEKPNGMFGSVALFDEVYEVDRRRRDIVRAVTEDFDLPFSIVAPFRTEHPIFRDLDAIALERSTKRGTLDMLMNAGPLHDALAELSLARGMAILGSSANKSLAGSKFRLEDVEPEIRAAADLEFDYGLCRYHNADGLSSTILDLASFEVIRRGCCFEQIAGILARYFGIEIEAP
jgi:tRNA A37 threonylcarbamoyladenosine synthetase subunit TsaC/SUA5/YrdC